jgi:hypothetical protein
MTRKRVLTMGVAAAALALGVYATNLGAVGTESQRPAGRLTPVNNSDPAMVQQMNSLSPAERGENDVECPNGEECDPFVSPPADPSAAPSPELPTHEVAPTAT